MDGAVKYRKERKVVSTPNIASIFSTSSAAAALAKATWAPSLVQAPGLTPTPGCLALPLPSLAPLAPGCSAAA